MSDATRKLNYDGIFVYLHDGKLDTLRVIHKYDDSGEHVRMSSLSGRTNEIIRNNNRVICLLNDKQRVVLNRNSGKFNSFPQNITDKLSEIKRFYALQLLGQERIAGRDAQIVAIQPRDQYRFGYRLWIDQNNGLLLKSMMVSPRNEPVEQMMFTSLKLPQQIASSHFDVDFTVPVVVAPKESDSSRHQAKTTWRFVALPEGFKQTAFRSQIRDDGSRVDHFMVTDGLAHVSVFVQKTNTQDKVNAGATAQGSINGYSKEHNGHNILAVGEVPMNTVQLIATSLTRP
jgi:sigma-E factor negative regulatory protein RseB